MLIDIHCHANLYLVLDEIIKEAQNEGVQKIISVGMSVLSIERILEISSNYDMIYPSLGIHPEEVKMNKDVDIQLDSIIDIIKKSKEEICAIGEIGLDHHFVKEKELYPLQKKHEQHLWYTWPVPDWLRYVPDVEAAALTQPVW